MFPLGTVLFPGALLPLHVFEPRYRQLVKDCLAGEPEFGVVLIDRGHEVGGGDVRRDVGTVARILEVASSPDGRYVVRPRGSAGSGCSVAGRRPLPPRRGRGLARRGRQPGHDRARGRGGQPGPPRAGAGQRAARRRRPLEIDIADDPLLASYHLCAVAPLGPDDRYRLLACAGPAERLDRLDELLTDAEEVLTLRLAAERADGRRRVARAPAGSAKNLSRAAGGPPVVEQPGDADLRPRSTWSRRTPARRRSGP